MKLLPTNCAINNVLHGEFLAKVILKPKSTGSVSSALFKYLTTFSLFLSLTEALVSDWHCLVNRVEAAMRRVLSPQIQQCCIPRTEHSAGIAAAVVGLDGGATFLAWDSHCMFSSGCKRASEWLSQVAWIISLWKHKQIMSFPLNTLPRQRPCRTTHQQRGRCSQIQDKH